MKKTTAVLLTSIVLALAAGFALAQGARANLPSRPAGTTHLTLFTGDGETIATSSVKKQSSGMNETLALRVEGTHDGRVVGTLMAKVDGKWVEVQLGPMDSTAGGH